MPYKDPEKQREAQRRWAKENYNPETAAEQRKKLHKHRKKKYFQIIAQFKVEGCERCGETDIACLDCHHDPDKGTKLERISVIAKRPRSFSEETLRKELAKCIVLCANCHRKEHFSRSPGDRTPPSGLRVPQSAY